MRIFELLSVVYACAVIGVVLYVVSLLSRLVKSNERIANALEAAATKPRRDDK